MKHSEQTKKTDNSIKADKKRIKELEKELDRKEKALAEAAALLLLRILHSDNGSPMKCLTMQTKCMT